MVCLHARFVARIAEGPLGTVSVSAEHADSRWTGAARIRTRRNSSDFIAPRPIPEGVLADSVMQGFQEVQRGRCEDKASGLKTSKTWQDAVVRRVDQAACGAVSRR
jgi:hypothetical protein